ncbi:type IV toxin-antitoxin system AbiEi family antitoxin domain-containing protein [soil metagenome]
MDLESHIWDLAERQHGVVGRRQLHHAGYTDELIDSLDRRSALDHLSCEVIKLRGTPTTEPARLMAAVLDSPPGAVVSHGSAAALWGIPGYEHRGGIHVTIPRQGTRQRSRLAVLHYHKDLPLSETVVLQGLPVTSPTLLVFHLAATEHPARTERVYDYVLSRHLSTPMRLKSLVDAIGGSGRNGTRVTRDLVASIDDQPLPESGLERRVEWLAKQGGVKVRRQVPLGDHEFIGRVDFHLVGRRGVIEAQSLSYHASPLSAEQDRHRFERLLALGRSVLTIWDYQAFHHRDHVIDQIQLFARQLDSGHPPFHRECPDL